MFHLIISSILHPQPNPLEIVVVQPPYRLDENQFIIFEDTLWYSDTMYANPKIQSI